MDSPTLLKNGAQQANLRTTTTIATILRADLQLSIPEEEDDQHSDHNSTSDSTVSDELFFTAATPTSSNFPSSLLKFATKIRTFFLRFKKHPNSRKIKMEDIFYRDHASSRRSNNRSSSSSSSRSCSEDAVTSPSKASKVHKYLNKIKPLSFYRPRFSSSGNVTASSSSSAKRLRKSRSASSAVAAVQSTPPRQLEEDGIQSAIAHCKRSFSGKDVVLARCRSDPGF